MNRGFPGPVAALRGSAGAVVRRPPSEWAERGYSSSARRRGVEAFSGFTPVLSA